MIFSHLRIAIATPFILLSLVMWLAVRSTLFVLLAICFGIGDLGVAIGGKELRKILRKIEQSGGKGNE